jgi:hypothetical protein
VVFSHHAFHSPPILLCTPATLAEVQHSEPGVSGGASYLADPAYWAQYSVLGPDGDHEGYMWLALHSPTVSSQSPACQVGVLLWVLQLHVM